jgi:hypothetical protein
MKIKAKPMKYKSKGRGKKFQRTYKPQRTLALSGFPNSKIVRLRYAESIGLNPVITGNGFYVFRANSIFDPNFTGVGHQPMGHDEWALSYNHYSVLGSKIKVTFCSTDTTYTNAASVCSVSRQADSTAIAISSGTRLQESGAPYKILGTPNSSNGQVVLTSYFSAKKHLKTTSNIPFNRASFGTNPSEEIYYHITMSPLDASQDLAVIYFYVEIDYVCLLSERRTLSVS